MTGQEAIAYAAHVCGGQLPTPDQWDAAFGRFYDPADVQQAIAEKDHFPQGDPDTGDVSPWGCQEMSFEGLEFTRYDAHWRQLVPHSEPTHSLQLRGRSANSLDGPLRIDDWNASGMPDNFLFGAKPVDVPSDEIGFRVVLGRLE
jgi:hypothetical protein